MGKAGKPGFYAVARGHVPGVYTEWSDCEAQTKAFKGCLHKKFNTLDAANAYLAENGVSGGHRTTFASPSTLPAVASSSKSHQSRNHGTKPYERHSSKKPRMSRSNEKAGSTKSRWSALSTEVVEDESGWNVVYSDGACKGNGNAGSVAGVGVWWGPGDSRNIAERCPGAQTNNRAELIAIVRVLETTPHSKHPLLIKTDSKYSISCFREWLPKWKRSNFKTSSGEPVKNRSLILYLDALLDQRARRGQKVHLQYVKGHAGIIGNEGADYEANQGVKKPLAPERDWDALTDALQEETPDHQVSSGEHRTPAISQADLEAFAAGLADDDEELWAECTEH
ncbi:ribonuclease H-like domain-containing protein [Epithele typhae]|uniref:ribonuclease H-like domain-containing protein n=1 Tax=Epithele typhae TaxID=378194 RepID=UPI002008CCED|nr:ribonuclease H-like domain-containing protein [Epithele typhae]KAH9938826.1 ribonuclease H-like domain-containing protein [Epithele typhae]